MAPNVSTLRPLIAGDVIIDVKPVLHVVHNHLKNQLCDYCLKISDKLKKCSNCLQMHYCGRNCQRNDWKYHKNECKVLAKKKFKSNESNSSERLLIRLWLTIESDQTFATKRHQLFDGSDISLIDIEVNVKELSEDIDRMIQFELICNHFKDYGIDFNRKELLHWFGLMSTSGVCHQFNSYSSYIGGPFLNSSEQSVGHGLYPQLYAVRHSCLPNSALITDGIK